MLSATAQLLLTNFEQLVFHHKKGEEGASGLCKDALSFYGEL